MKLDEINPALLATIDPELESGRMAGIAFAAGSSSSIKDFPFGFDGLHRARMLWKRTNYHQIMGACSVSSVAEDPDPDLWKVKTNKVTRKRKWYKVKVSPPAEDSELQLDLEWPVTTTVSPSGSYATRAAGGVVISPPSCVATDDEEDTMPSNWFTGPEGDPPEGWAWQSVDEDSVGEDTEIITLSAINSAAAAAEVILSTQNWAVVKTYSRRIVGGFSLAIGTTSAARINGAVSRTKFEFKVAGRRIPCTLKWKERTYKDGTTPPDYTDEEHKFNATTGWEWEWDIPYPASQYRFQVIDMILVPV